jgi:hypothetical protein
MVLGGLMQWRTDFAKEFGHCPVAQNPMAWQLLRRSNTTKVLPMTKANLNVEKIGLFSLHW